MFTVVLAEKPSVAREIARVVGAHDRRAGYLEGAGYRVTWALGHLVRLATPEEIDPAWKVWSNTALPMLPNTFRLTVIENTRGQFHVVERLLRDSTTKAVIAATDAGREGELIFRWIHEKSGRRGSWRRLWLSSLTPEAIRAAFQKLEPAGRYDGLASAALARSQADWLAGLNFTRAYTLRANGPLLSVGRVQTPTLAMVVQRDREIAAFVPTPYLEVEATFEGARGRYKGTYFVPAAEGLRDDDGKVRQPRREQFRLPTDFTAADAIARRVRAAAATVVAADQSTRRIAAPALYDLNELQRDANRLFGWSAKRTLDVAQSLYERGLLSYPRTDSRHLTQEIALTLSAIVRAIAPRYAGLVAAGSGANPLGKRYVDDTKVSDHHAILPTARTHDFAADTPEALVHDLVCRRLLMAWHDDRQEGITTVVTEVRANEAAPADLFFSSGKTVEATGWSVLELRKEARSSDQDALVPAGLAAGDAQRVVVTEARRKETEPPKPFTDATLLTAMERAGRVLDNEEIAAALRDRGLGTPATRAGVIETLLARNYLVREGKSLKSTALAVGLIDVLDDDVRSPALTGQWELRLRRIERGEEQLDAFMRDIRLFVVRGVEAATRVPSAKLAGLKEIGATVGAQQRRENRSSGVGREMQRGRERTGRARRRRRV